MSQPKTVVYLGENPYNIGRFTERVGLDYLDVPVDRGSFSPNYLKVGDVERDLARRYIRKAGQGLIAVVISNNSGYGVGFAPVVQEHGVQAITVVSSLDPLLPHIQQPYLDAGITSFGLKFPADTDRIAGYTGVTDFLAAQKAK
jgi:hypothetical protein